MIDGINMEVFRVGFVHGNVKYVTVFVFDKVFNFNPLFLQFRNNE